MYFKNSRALQTMTLFVVICLANTFIFASVPKNPEPPEDLFTGILTAFDPQSVKVNGYTAFDGMTILSGAEIATSKTGGATIDLAKLGRVELNPETIVRLDFSEGHIKLIVSSGQVKLTAYKGIIGEMTDVNGKIVRTDSTLDVSSIWNDEILITNSLPSVPSPAPNGLGIWSIMTIVNGVVGASMLTWVAVADPSNEAQISVSNVRP